MDEKHPEQEAPKAAAATPDPKPAEASQKEEQASLPVTILCIVALLIFVGWIGWRSFASDEQKAAVSAKFDKAAKAFTSHSTPEAAEKADPELKSMITLRKKGSIRSAELKGVKVDINTASAEQLATVPILSEWDINSIIKMRPFASVEELKAKKVIGATRYTDCVQFLTASSAAK